jgi:hypothetical protein
LFHEFNFRRRLSDRWFELRSGPFHTDSVMNVIDGWAVLLAEAQARNFTRWPILGRELWRSLPGWSERDTYEHELEYMKQYLRWRLEWIDSELRETSGTESPAVSGKPAAIRIKAAPNPFRSGTTIRCSGPLKGSSELIVYNLLGRKVAAMKLQPDSYGAGTARWDGRDGRGNAVAAGIYILQLSGNGEKPAAERIFKY